MNAIGKSFQWNGSRVFRCVGCRKLAVKSRRDQLTCSGACRVKAHRNGSAETLRKMAKQQDVDPAGVVECQAIDALSPETAKEILYGTMTIEQAQAAVYPKFADLLRRACLEACNASEEALQERAA